jgi:hypothetical protein
MKLFQDFQTVISQLPKVLLSITWCLSISACGTATKLLKADPAPPSGFIEKPEQMVEMRDHAPFHALWFKDREEFDRVRGKYKNIYFAPVSTTYLQEKGWWDSLNEKDSAEYRKEVEEFAKYVRKAFNTAFKNDPLKKHIVVDTVDASTIVYEIAITELIATKAHINAAGTVLGAFVPGGGLVKATAKGSVAIEVKVIDGETNQVIITWADREQDQSSLFSLSDFSWYSHARKAVDTWAEQLVELHNSTTKDRVEDSAPFTINPL